MKKFFAIYLCIICIVPTLVMADCTSRNDSCSTCESRSSCLARGGCGYDVNDPYEPCKECTREQFHEAQQNCNGNDSCSDACKSCDGENPDWTYGTGQIFDINNQDIGMISCPWKCVDGWFKSNDGNSCVQCPDNTHTQISGGNHQIFGQYDHVSDCNCATPERPDQYLIHSVETYSPYREVYYCGVCSVGARSVYNNSGNTIYACDCNSAHAKSVFGGTAIPILGTTEANYANFWIECQCPEHSNIILSRLNNDYYVCACKHNDGYIMSETAPWTCSRCQDTNAELYGTNDYCTCKEGYYGTLNGNSGVCTKCPIGTTIARGQSNTTKADCHVSCNTKFYTNNTNYMRLIPSGNGCSTSGTNGELHQTYNGSQAHSVH